LIIGSFRTTKRLGMKEALIKKWRKANVTSEKQYKKIVKKLAEKKNKKVLKQVGDINDQVFREMSCMDCANCCKSIPPQLLKSDVKRISKHLGLSKQEFEYQYTVLDDDGDRVFNQSPCVFLQDDNACSIYEVRPEACREYPHTGNQRQFKDGLSWHAINTIYCPATYNILERMHALMKVK